MTKTQTFSVPDMSCGHCRASIDTVLVPLGGQAVYDMDRRHVTVTGDLAPKAVIDALDRIGFMAEPV